MRPRPAGQRRAQGPGPWLAGGRGAGRRASRRSSSGRGVGARVLVSSFNPLAVRLVDAARAGHPRGAAVRARVAAAAAAAPGPAPLLRPAALHPEIVLCSAERVAALAAARLHGERLDGRRPGGDRGCRDMRVDGVITNDPARAPGAGCARRAGCPRGTRYDGARQGRQSGRCRMRSSIVHEGVVVFICGYCAGSLLVGLPPKQRRGRASASRRGARSAVRDGAEAVPGDRVGRKGPAKVGIGGHAEIQVPEGYAYTARAARRSCSSYAQPDQRYRAGHPDRQGPGYSCCSSSRTSATSRTPTRRSWTATTS